MPLLWTEREVKQHFGARYFGGDIGAHFAASENNFARLGKSCIFANSNDKDMKRFFSICLILSVFVVNVNAQMVGATNRQGGVSSSGGPDPQYRETGWRLNAEVGTSTSVSVGYQFTPNIMVGAGMEMVSDFDYMLIWGPAFAQLRLTTPMYRWSFFADLRFGWTVFSFYGGYSFSQAMVGIGYKNWSLGGGVAFSPSLAYDRGYDNLGDTYVYQTNIWTPIVSLSYSLPLKLKGVFF